MQITGGKDRARLFAWLQVATNVGSLGGAFLGGLILDSFPFAAINLTAGMICALCAAIAWASLPVPPVRAVTAGPAAAVAAVQKASTDAPVTALLLLMGMLLASRMVLQVPFSLYMTQVFGARNWITGLSYGLLAFGFVVAAPLWARLFEDRSRSYVLGWSVLISTACLLVTHLAGTTTSVATFAMLYFVWGALLGGTTPVLLSLISAAIPHDRQGSALGLAHLAAGGLRRRYHRRRDSDAVFGLQAVFPLVSILYALSFLMALGIWLKARQPAEAGSRP